MATPLIKIGTVHFIGEITSINGKNGVFNKREFYIKVDRRDPHTDEIVSSSYVKFELGKNKLNLVDRFKLGDRVAVLFDVDGQFYDGGKNPDGSVIWKHVQHEVAYNILTIDEYKERYASRGAQPNVTPQPSATIPQQQNVEQSAIPASPANPVGLGPVNTGNPFAM